jgi:hypothetical protein
MNNCVTSCTCVIRAAYIYILYFQMLAFKAKQRRLREEKSKAVEQARNSFRLEQQAAR